MADRKISELSEAQQISKSDIMVVVTGVGVPSATLTTNKFPVSGLLKHVVNIDELVNAGTGIHLVATTGNDIVNTLRVNVTGYAYTSHNHLAANITDLGSAVSGYVQQIVKFQSTDLAATGTTYVDSSDLSIQLAANSKYVCELGTVFVNNEEASNILGGIKVTGTMEVNYPTKLYGTWNHVYQDNQGYGYLRNTISAVTGYGSLAENLHSSALNQPLTIINKFTVETTNNESDTINFRFATNSTNAATSGVLKKGSWLKAEKII